MKTELIDRIKKRAKELFAEVKELREHLHAHPELSYQEFDTMHFVAEKLRNIGLDPKIGVGKTGVTALITHANFPADTPCIGLRADLDALPIIEQNDVPYVSKNPGVMHACGHDVHTSILLGAAHIIYENREELKAPVKLIFQPGEEQNPGGATLMIADGVLEAPKVMEMVALHVFPDMEVGKVGFKEGMYMASCDEIHLTIHGKGGHAATPHQCVDPIVIGANIITALQQVVSRHCDPKIPSVLSFGHFEALGATNVIPSEAHLKGTFRTMNEAWRKKGLELIEQMIRQIAQVNGATVSLDISKGYPFLVNDENVTDKIKTKAVSMLGNENVEELPIRMTSEDFSFYSQEVPVCFFRLGVRNEEKGIIYGVHHPKFNIDDQALIVGMEIMASAAF